MVDFWSECRFGCVFHCKACGLVPASFFFYVLRLSCKQSILFEFGFFLGNNLRIDRLVGDLSDSRKGCMFEWFNVVRRKSIFFTKNVACEF